MLPLNHCFKACLLVFLPVTNFSSSFLYNGLIFLNIIIFFLFLIGWVLNILTILLLILKWTFAIFLILLLHLLKSGYNFHVSQFFWDIFAFHIFYVIIILKSFNTTLKNTIIFWRQGLHQFWFFNKIFLYFCIRFCRSVEPY